MRHRPVSLSSPGRRASLALALAAVLTGACSRDRGAPGRPAASTQPAQREAGVMTAITSPDLPATEGVSWRVTKMPGLLQIDYQVTNRTNQRIHVRDGLVNQVGASAFRVGRGLSFAPTTDGRLELGVMPPGEGREPLVVPMPGHFVPVEPGASFQGRRQLALPATDTDHTGRLLRLPEGLTQVSLRIEAFDGEPGSWREVPGQDGQPIRIPEGYRSRVLVGATQPLL